MSIKNNTASLQNILDAVNALPSASGIELPTLTNEGSASDLLSGKQLIDDEGNVVNGTFTIDSELTTQDSLIAQIQSVVNNLPESREEPVLQTKTVTPTTSTQNVTPDGGYDGLSKVTVNAIPTTTQATPSISVGSSGLITASTTQTAGYVDAGTKSATKQLTTQEAKTVTPSTSSQTAVASGVYTTGAVTVAAIPSTYVKPTTTKAATTYTPTTSDQTIAAGTYCSGGQTIKGDSNLIDSNIKSGVSIFGVIGSYEGSGGSGGESVEMCTGAITFDAPTMDTHVVYAVDSNLQVVTTSASMMDGDCTFSVAKGTIVAVAPWTSMCNIGGNATQIFSTAAGGAFIVNGDFTLEYA